MERNEYTIDVIDRSTDAAGDAGQGFSYLLACIFCLALTIFFSIGILVRTCNKPVVRLQTRINPNDASAASLIRLPQVGFARAAKIIAYRDDSIGDKPVFTCPDDLQKVKGIGPVIAFEVSDYLRFDKEK